VKVIIAGSRTITSYKHIEEAVKKSGYKITNVISGAARGVDQLGEMYARLNNIPLTSMPADWDKYGKAAGPIRNAEMGKVADAAVIVWDGKSRGSKNMMDIMTRLEKPYYVLIPKEED